MRHLILFIALTIAGCASQQSSAAPYPAPESLTEAAVAIDEVLAEAASSGRLAMLVLGANWCHDSTDFAAMIEQPELAAWLGEHYVIRLFNIGYLDHIRDYLAPFGVPVIYGTPTVLVVDPGNRQLLNPVQHYYWRNASKLTASDARTYFSAYFEKAPPAEAPSRELQDALDRIDAFEASQAERIYRAYAVLGPLLQAVEEGGDGAEFQKKWVNLAKMRGSITGDLQRLRESAREQDAAGAGPIQLDFPDYPLFID